MSKYNKRELRLWCQKCMIELLTTYPYDGALPEISGTDLTRITKVLNNNFPIETTDDGD